jgi:hypothetical protein
MMREDIVRSNFAAMSRMAQAAVSAAFQYLKG